MDPFENFKAMQKQGWAHFAPLEMITTPVGAQLAKFAGVRAGQQVLDVGCGTGVAAITAARMGAMVSAIDLTPELLERARANSKIAALEVDWREGDVEQLPYGDGAFDVVLSEFGHMFAPRPGVALGEMLRVLKPGGTIAFATWPPELLVGSMFRLIASYMPPPPPGISPPPQWGDQNIVRERLGSAVKDIAFQRETMRVPALSLQHYQAQMERTAGPLVKLVEMLSANDPAKLAAFRSECAALAAKFYDENIIKQEYMMTRATKN
ncbi:MAG: class I SAM-dependent methyltransferase [Candidatus Acidiferrales bacterium]